ncbi:MAG: SPFH domain-containing protein [Lapillicoccus sp.]
MMTILIVIAVLLFSVCIAVVVSVCVVQQYESGVVFRLGKVQDPARGPGLTLLRPVVDRMTKVNRQVMTLSVPAQDCITKDNVSVRVDAVVYFRVVDAVKVAVNVQDYQAAISRLAQTSLRSVIGRAELDDLLSSREKLGAELTEIIDAPSEQPWRVTPHEPAHTTPQGPVGPQDAPRRGPRDAARGLQDAAGGPQDAAQADVIIEQVEESVDPLDTLIEGERELLALKARDAFGLDKLSSERPSKTSTTGKRVAAELASTIAVPKRRGATKGLREFAAGRRMPFVMFGRDDASEVLGGDLTRERATAAERTILDSLPRPVGGPAYLGGRDDAAYLRGWDDAVDWNRQSNQAHAPSWGSAAYMTGWNDAGKAIAKARRAEGLPLRSAP